MDTLQTSPDDAPLRHDRPLRNGDSSSHASSSPASGRGPAPGTASRGRKSRALPLDSMSPAAVQGRKRAMDRKSQQAFRDKNKNYIAYLEQTVDACAAGNETNMVGQLLKRNQQLYKANERLRKILNDTLFSLQLELSSLPSNDEATENSFPMEPVSISAPPLDLALMHPTSSVPPLDASIEVANINVTPPPPHTTSHTSLHQFQDPQEWFMDGKASNGAFRSCQREYPGLQFAVAQSSLNPLTSLHCDSFLVNPSQEDFWHWSNSVYARIFVFPPWQARLATDFQDDVIFKAIRNGWDSLNANMQQNPIVQILRDYDDMISITTTKINRAVIAFKNAALIKYYLGRDNAVLEQLPLWLRPRPVQREMQHPILIDFFPWPNLRERFVRGFGCIEAHKFSILLLLHFKFQWPFSFDDTFVYDALGDTYQANPLFQLYYQDLNCWTMESSFFHEYPELREDILSHPSGTAFKPVERAPQD